MMERLGSSLRSACGADDYCAGMAVRLAGFLWEYRESFSVQTRVYRCVGQYALRQGYRFGVSRFVGEIGGEAEATSMVTYLYECAVPGWARAWFDGQETTPPIPPDEVGQGQRTAPAGQRTTPAPGGQRSTPAPGAGQVRGTPAPGAAPTASWPGGPRMPPAKAASGGAIDMESAARSSALLAPNRAGAATAP